jgi:hypothetical protein
MEIEPHVGGVGRKDAVSLDITFGLRSCTEESEKTGMMIAKGRSAGSHHI